MNDKFQIEIFNLKKSFGNNLVLKDINLKIKKSEIFGIAGEDGAGKTTFERVLSGILKPDIGRILIEGKDLFENSEKIREEISYLPQNLGVYEDLTLRENLEFYGDIYNLTYKEKRKRMDELLSLFNLKKFENFYVSNISGGMKQKLGLCCALINKPKILILDEPTRGIDPLSRLEFWNILEEILKENITIIISTSYLNELEKCTSFALLKKGEVILEGSPIKLKKDFSIEIYEIFFKGEGKILILKKEIQQYL